MPQVNKFMFRGYDLRGVVNEDLTPEIVEHLGRAHGTMLKRAGLTQALVDVIAVPPAKSFAALA